MRFRVVLRVSTAQVKVVRLRTGVNHKAQAEEVGEGRFNGSSPRHAQTLGDAKQVYLSHDPFHDMQSFKHELIRMMHAICKALRKEPPIRFIMIYHESFCTFCMLHTSIELQPCVLVCGSMAKK